jgi:cysteine desulfurase
MPNIKKTVSSKVAARRRKNKKMSKKPSKNKIDRVYLDYGAATPVDPRVLKKLSRFPSEVFGNTMSLHSFGQEAKEALEESREIVADLIKAKPQEIIFTGSATESNNLALKGVAFANKEKGNHIIISPIEHPCVGESARWLESQGFEVTKLKVDRYGLVDTKEVESLIKKETILVSVMHANNEIGTVEPIEEIGRICRERGVYFHTDAAQSLGKILIDVNKMNIDLLTGSSQKMYGPKGAACLFVREGVKISPIMHGGGQEFGLRPSTVNIPAIYGFAQACLLCKKEMAKEEVRFAKLRDKLINGVMKKIEGSHLNGHPEKRLPNNANFWFDFIEGESLIIQLDLAGIAGSTGSACSSAKLQPSHVLLATGLRPQEAHGSLRLTLGRWTTDKEISYVLKVLPGIIKQLREISPFKRQADQ